MNCPKCGTELKPNEMFCANCGALISSANADKTSQNVPAQQSDAEIKTKGKPGKSPDKKKNLAIKITAIVLAIAVFLTGGIFLFDTISYKNSVEGAEFIKDFPVLKLRTEFKVYDEVKFPVEEYKIEVEQYKGSNVLKSETFARLEKVIDETSSKPIFTIEFPEDGNYRITLTDITASRIQPMAVVIEVEVDDDDPKAVDNVDLNSGKDYGRGKKSAAPEEMTLLTEATQTDFDELETTLNDLFSLFYDPSYDCETADLSYVLDSFWKCGGAYYHYFGESEYENGYEKLPEEDVRWICENIYNIKYDTNIEYADYSYLYENGYFYIASYDVGGNEWYEYEVSSYSVVGDKYEIILDTLRHSYETEDVVFISKIKVTASIKVIDGKKYWSLYKVENNYQGGELTQNEETTVPVINTPTEPSTQAPTQAPTQTPSGTVPLDKNVKVGDYVKFGKYEQDNNTSNGKEDIEWLVLDVKDGKALVTSKYALDAQVYNKECVEITWENCTLRSWLNNEFYNTAFSSQEQSKIPTVKVVAEDSPNFGTEAGNDTLDKVFLLSEGELERYLGTDEKGSCLATPYALAQGAYVYANRTDSNCWLWLRSPGVMQDSAAGVAGGGLYDAGYPVDDKNLAVRPVIWVELG